MVEQVDTSDLKSDDPKGSCGFKSHLEYKTEPSSKWLGYKIFILVIGVQIPLVLLKGRKE